MVAQRLEEFGSKIKDRVSTFIVKRGPKILNAPVNLATRMRDLGTTSMIYTVILSEWGRMSHSSLYSGLFSENASSQLFKTLARESSAPMKRLNDLLDRVETVSSSSTHALTVV